MDSQWAIGIGAVTLLVALLGQWGIMGFYAGRTTKAVEGLTDRVSGHHVWLKEVNDQVNDHEGRIMVVESRCGVEQLHDQIHQRQRHAVLTNL